MKEMVLLLLISFSISCSDNSGGSGNTGIPEELGWLQQDSFILKDHYPIPLDSFVSIYYTVKNVHNTFKFDYLRTNEKYLAESDGYNSNNQRVEHLRFSPGGNIEEHIIYIYKDGKLNEEYRLERSSQDEVLYKTQCAYTTKGELSSKVTFVFRKDLKQGVNKGINKPGGCIIDQDDFEEKKSWGSRVEEIYSYTLDGILSEKKTLRDNSSAEIEIFKYDNGKVVEETTLSNGEMIRKISTRYFKDSMDTNSTFYKIGMNTGNIIKYRYDNKGNLLDVQAIDKESGKQFYRRLYTYNAQNERVKEEYVTDLGISCFTLYEYVINDSSVNKKFVVDNK